MNQDIIFFVKLSIKIRGFESHYRYIESIARKSGLSRPVLSCQKHNLKPSLVQYIYRISYKIAKRQTQRNGFALFKNDITGSEPTVKMLDT